MGKRNQSFTSRVQNFGAPKPKRKNRNNKSASSVAKSAARKAKQAGRPQKGMTRKSHHDGLKGGGQG